MKGTPRAADQRAALVHAFLARFFENEITGGTNDLKQSFFWLMSFLAAPGIFMPVLMAFQWNVFSLFGTNVLRIMSRGDKVFYLDFSMIAAAVVSAIVWNSLLIDRRDALVIGAWPVRPRTVIVSKLMALGAYFAIVATAMHAVAAVAWGFFLAAGNTVPFALRGVAAHFVASFAASVFVLVSVAGAQGLVLAIVGPRRFARVSPILQLLLVMAIGVAVFTLPMIAGSVVDTFGSPGTPSQAALRNLGGNAHQFAPRPWILSTPPLWFLGLYEWILGTRDAVQIHLARVAILAFGAATTVTLASFVFAYRRLMVTLVEQGAGFGQLRRSAAIVGVLTRTLTRQPERQAVVQFFLTTATRVERHRLALAVGVGASLAWALPTFLRGIRLSAMPATPDLDLLTLPISMTLFVLVGLRVAMSLPGDLKASWIFDVQAPPRREIRLVMERLLFAIGVAPMLIIFLPMHWHFWGARVALMHFAFALAIGLLLIQLLLRGFDGVPCARPWRPERVNLRMMWPIFLIGFLWLVNGMEAAPGHPDSALELIAFRAPVFGAILLSTLIAIAAILRWRAIHEITVPHDDDESLAAIGVLNLN